MADDRDDIFEGFGEFDDDDQPQEGDYTTEDHLNFYQYGKLVVEVPNEKQARNAWINEQEKAGKEDSRYADDDLDPEYVYNVEDFRYNDDWKPHVKAHMEKEQFFPNIFWISDHGNVNLLSIEEDDDEKGTK